jgi:predicted ATPase
MPKQPITRIRAKNFRSLADVDVRLGPFTVLIGPNGSGKTNLLKVLQFLATMARVDLEEAVRQWGGFDHVQRQSAGLGSVELQLDGHTTEHATQEDLDEYLLVIQSESPTAGLWRFEKFDFNESDGRRRVGSVPRGTLTITWDETGETGRKLASAQTTALATLPRLSDEDGGLGIRDFAQMLQDIQVYEFDVQKAREAAPAKQGRLSSDGSNLADALMSLKERAPDAWGSLILDAKRCLPGLTDVHLEVIGGGGRSVVVQLIESGVTTPIDLRDASFGTVRLLALLCLLHEPDPPPLIAIEELDHGLHPYALDILVDRLRAASRRTQVIVTTHSATFVNRLRPEEIVICDRDPQTGASVIPAMSAEQIAEALKGYDGRAGDLWFAGALGGVPD